MAAIPMLSHAFFEGQIVPFGEAKVSIGTNTLQYGTGAFAGIRGYLDADGETVNIFRLPDHSARLLRSAKLLRAELPFDRDSLAATIVALAERNAPTGDIYIRPFVYKPGFDLTPKLRGMGDELAIYMLQMGDYLDTSKGVRAVVSSWKRIADNAIPSRGKFTGAYVNSAFAKDEAEEKGGEEALLLNEQGKVAEGSGCNVFIVRDGVLTTPPISADILEGITRRSFIRFAVDAGIPVEQREIDRSEVYLADEAFFCGTGVQVSPIIAIDGRPIGEGVMGPITSRLRDIFFDTVRGRNDRYAEWLTPVRQAVPVAAG
ncbi:MAG: branched-chain amino acid transaminase [Chloroflexota bacterium]|nr:branched-chain amino acid transaminase [Chloroflexia bacterium]MDQ3167061.1 branched-chain amino acid transaminase [Chloroflexota bacterium]